jgi:predicted nucleic acid-binding protein
MIYLDSAYIAKCYLREPGSDAVLDLVETSAGRASLLLALTEVQSVFHRHLREGKLTPSEYNTLGRRFADDQTADLWQWLPVTEKLIRESVARLQTLPASLFLRSADCLHLCAAADAGFKEIYSNDRHLLAAAPHFGLRPLNVIPERG